MKPLTRRSFLKSTAVLVAGTMAAGKVFGANERIGICVIGFNGQGSSHIKGHTWKIKRGRNCCVM
jgi:hypothetical protein